MFSKISSLTLAILLFLVLLGSKANYYVFATSIGVLILASLAINFKRLNFTWPHLLLPVIYLVGVGSVFVVITSPTIRLLFLLAASAIFFVMELKLGRESHFLQNVFLLTVFAWYVGLFAAAYYFRLSAVWIALSTFAATYLFGLQGFAGFSLPAKKYFHLLIAVVCAECAWGLSFWPTHFFVNAVVLFCIFYLIWIFAFSAFFGKLTKEKIYLQVSLILIVLALTLSTTAWRVVG